MMLCVGFYRISRESHENNLATLAATRRLKRQVTEFLTELS
jgi:hypothetical protein